MSGTDLATGFSIAGMISAFIGLLYWTANTRVSYKQCDNERDHNKRRHAELTQLIRDTEARTERRHRELRDDLKEIKTGVNGNKKSN
jgi:hypothetical protein